MGVASTAVRRSGPGGDRASGSKQVPSSVFSLPSSAPSLPSSAPPSQAPPLPPELRPLPPELRPTPPPQARGRLPSGRAVSQSMLRHPEVGAAPAAAAPAPARPLPAVGPAVLRVQPAPPTWSWKTHDPKGAFCSSVSDFWFRFLMLFREQRFSCM